ncbi:hypothetical protein [Anaerophilus nitritogenes]|uniref:hypothetical protein n=1 Tax=Anaerophilus nitritogenes TaxID=2498136 RepID=UPI00101DCE17|nr:hypothetical protein [Anaerophilus nitritogenes]
MPDIYFKISLGLSLITMIIYTIGSEFNYLKKLEFTIYNVAIVSFLAIMFSGIWKIKPLRLYLDEDFNNEI